MPNWLLHLVPMFVKYRVYSKGDDIESAKIKSEFSYAPHWVACEGEPIGEFTAFCWLCWSPDVWRKYLKIVDKYMLTQIPASILKQKSVSVEKVVKAINEVEE